eukprot:1424683-Prymnesium_polylepis.1
MKERFGVRELDVVQWPMHEPLPARERYDALRGRRDMGTAPGRGAAVPAREPQRVRRQECRGQLYLRAIVVLVFRDEQLGRARGARRLLRRRAVRRAR